MNRYVFVDSRIRKIEEEKLKSCDFNIIKLVKSNSVYEEISSHVDIFISKLENTLIIEKNMYDNLKKNSDTFNKLLNDSEVLENLNIIVSDDVVGRNYPLDIKYNVCSIYKNVIHNFKYTSKDILKTIELKNFNKINIKQGYSNCSIAVIDNTSCIVQDISIKKELENQGIYCLLVKDVNKNIKLLNNGEYSNMNGFIGGAIANIDDKIIVFGDLSYIDNENIIRNFITSKNKKIIEFKNFDVIDYGGIVVI